MAEDDWKHRVTGNTTRGQDMSEMGSTLLQGHLGAYIAKLEAEAEVMRKTIADAQHRCMEWSEEADALRCALRAEQAHTDKLTETIRRLADENAMLKSQMSELGLRIYGTDTPECPDQVLRDRAIAESEDIKPDMEKFRRRATDALKNATPEPQRWISAPALATGPQGQPE
jgi:predicted nuclease with TOPRIM domain